MQKRVANVIAQLLINKKVEYVFGVTGKTIAPFLDALLDYEQIEYIAAKHENGAALMAYGYAQGSGNIGVCCGSTGGGSTNLATGVATAFMNSVPMLVITGQVSTQDYGKGAFQESTGFGQSIDTVDFFRSVTKESFAAINPLKVADAIEYGIRSAQSGRMGPVHINIPFDIQQAEIDLSKPDFNSRAHTNGIVGESTGLKEALSLLDSAQKPVFLVGWGAVQSEAHKEIIEISENLEIPVATTIQGKGAIPSDHPLCLGVVGICGHQVAVDYVFDQSDLLIAVGTSFGEFSTYGWDSRFLSKKKIIQIDIDNREIGKNYPVEIGLTGNAKIIIHQLNLMIRKAGIKAKPSGRLVSEFINSLGRVMNPEKMGDNSVPLKPQRLFELVNKISSDNTLFLADSSSHWAWSMHYLKIKKNGNFYPTLGLGAMGASIGSAIGIKLSRNDNPVVCICGDGSFLMGGNEVATAGQFNIPVIWIVFNDSRYGMPEASIKRMYNRTIGVSLSDTNFAKMAESMGVTGFRVDNSHDFARAYKDALALGQPVVIDVLIDKTEIPPIGKRKLIPED
ncbi:thiamine pyrophosphate-binding protein [Marinilabilia rubra]|uniref:Thiamine pyrophosphate-binding protein n=1 Tax=Marinilabilia rubra TaxID=2162893 RepID=A0A2U2B7T7_9BACT|nr:thiamine pyrophosphate-binding protein [Marinilabilia rubra]PWD99106.1 thiamine pyrophosphate-binding protein [Marinilabilia rubra]